MGFIEFDDWLKNHPHDEDKPISTANTKEYTLQKVVLFSRHNIRAPFNDSNLAYHHVSNRKWIKWTSADGQLSTRGGLLEVQMGQYFRKYFEQTNFIKLNEVPNDSQVRVYANSIQRTIATANFFITSVFPLANIPVEHHYEVGEDDPIFLKGLPTLTDTLKGKITLDLHAFSETRQFEMVLHEYKDAFRYLEQIVDFKQSVYAQQNQLSEFDLDDIALELIDNQLPQLHGTLRIALNASDALVLQSYEGTHEEKAFGHTLTFNEWRTISSIKDLYCDVTFTAPTIAKLWIKPLLNELANELQNTRKLSVLVGHDINIGAILSAIDAYDYVLPYSIEQRTPIGSKILIEKWLGKDGVDYANVQLVYFSLEQLQTISVLDLENPPMRFDLTIKGLQKNADGLYLYDDVVQRFNDVIEEVEQLESR